MHSDFIYCNGTRKKSIFTLDLSKYAFDQSTKAIFYQTAEKKASRPRLLNFKLDSFFSFPVETIHDFCLKSCETAQKEELNITVQHLRFRGLWPSYLNRCVKDFCTIR